MKTTLLVVAVLVLIVYLFEDSAHTTYPPGVLVPEEPSQYLLLSGPTWQQGKHRYTARADFSMRARVLSTERYFFDGSSAVSPVDFAVGWGPMSDQAVIDQIGWGQGGRWYRYWPKGRQFPLPVPEIVSHTANLHMIPAGREVLKVLRSVRAGDLISLSGNLVDVQSDSGWRWHTSLSRTDSGSGACEIVWVTSLVVH